MDDDYEVWRNKRVEVEAGEETFLDITLKRFTGSLNIKRKPENAIIIVDGKEIGNTPAGITLETGKHLVVVKMKGYENWSESVVIEHGKENLVDSRTQTDPCKHTSNS